MSAIKPPLIIGNNDYTKVPQWGIIGRTDDGDRSTLGLDLNELNTICLFGAQKAGKSYSLGTMIESFLTPIPGLNNLPSPGCALVFHYSQSQKYKPELTLMGRPNSNGREVTELAKWGGSPMGVPDVVLLSPESLVEERRREFPGFKVVPLLFHESEVNVEGYMNLMGDAESGSFEIEVLTDIMESMRHNLNPDGLLKAVQEHPLLDTRQKNFLELKLRRSMKFIKNSEYLADIFRPGRLIICDLRDEFLSKAQAFRIMLLLLSLFQDAKNPDGSTYPKVLVADEAHEYARDPYLVESFTRMVRMMRHISMTIMIASQDPPSIHHTIKELSSILIMLNMETEAWVTNLADSKYAIKAVPVENYLNLPSGECWIWSRFASDQRFMRAPQKCVIRPRASMHGGFSKTAIQV